MDGDNFGIQNAANSCQAAISSRKSDRVWSKLTSIAKDDQPFIPVPRGYEREASNPHPGDRARTLRYIEGFHAANPRSISVHSLVKGMKADEKIDGEQAYRIRKGYRELLEIFESRIDDVPVDLNTQVESIRWSKGEVKITTRSKSKRKIYEISHAMTTVPLAVLQSKSIKFTPSLPTQKRQALSKLAMGKVIRVTLCFRERFWESLRVNNKSLSKLSFLFSDDKLFPTWWTQMPSKTPVIVGGAPFHAADQLTGHSLDAITHKATRALSTLLHIDQRELQNLLSASYSHDWEADPFSRGAYSYVKVGGEATHNKISASPSITRYFSPGEATDITGYNGTVHGAMASGQRAAKEILRAIA